MLDASLTLRTADIEPSPAVVAPLQAVAPAALPTSFLPLPSQVEALMALLTDPRHAEGERRPLNFDGSDLDTWSTPLLQVLTLAKREGLIGRVRFSATGRLCLGLLGITDFWKDEIDDEANSDRG